MRHVLALLLALTVGIAHTGDARASGLLVAGTADGRPVAHPEGPPVTIRTHRVTARIDERVAHVEVEQVFRNHTNERLEGTYLFPLPEGASVSAFAMTMGEKLVQGEILEARKARAIYEGIVRRQRDPGLLEYVGRGLFRARVFPIEPRGDVTVKLSFQQVVPESAGTMEFRYPLATDRFHGGAVQTAVVDVAISSRAAIRTIYSPSHSIAVVREDPTRARVTYENAGGNQRRDFVLYVGRSAADVAFSLLSHKPAGERGTFLSIFAPPIAPPSTERLPKDVVYVLDTSGSMKEDGKLEQARRALEHGVRTLAAGDRFNIVSFSSGIVPFRDTLVEATRETKRAAGHFLAGLRASRRNRHRLRAPGGVSPWGP